MGALARMRPPKIWMCGTMPGIWTLDRYEDVQFEVAAELQEEDPQVEANDEYIDVQAAAHPALSSDAAPAPKLPILT
eukprot:4530572-Amphidinium_carterae.1